MPMHYSFIKSSSNLWYNDLFVFKIYKKYIKINVNIFIAQILVQQLRDSLQISDLIRNKVKNTHI